MDVTSQGWRMCPLHEMDAFDANQAIGELNDDFLDILANMNFDNDNTPIVNISQPANNINVINRNPLIQVGIQNLIAANRANIEQHSCGQLDQICPPCRAKFFINERNSRRMYNKCCAGRNVILAPFHQHPIDLLAFKPIYETYLEMDRSCTQYKVKYIITIVMFASIQANLRNIPGNGPFVYAIQGQIYHHYSDVNVNRDRQNYGPIYYLDPQEAIQQRINNAGEINVNPALIELIENELRDVNRERIARRQSICSTIWSPSSTLQ
ncbi:hypothetical protein QE152_g28560 [Popillia japonica]|uniref:Uncharacterized protein n=1 Tax=Popillia japonica TaxID=7064 RepID=A0AAW1JKT9_POPJA